MRLLKSLQLAKQPIGRVSVIQKTRKRLFVISAVLAGPAQLALVGWVLIGGVVDTGDDRLVLAVGLAAAGVTWVLALVQMWPARSRIV